MTAPKRARVWSEADCPLCDKALQHLTAQGYEIEKKSASALITGKEPDMDALVQLTLQTMSLPIIELDGNFIHPGDLYNE